MIRFTWPKFSSLGLILSMCLLLMSISVWLLLQMKIPQENHVKIQPYLDSKPYVLDLQKLLFSLSYEMKKTSHKLLATYVAYQVNNHSTSTAIHSACVAEPTITDSTIGLAAFLLITLDNIGLCHLLGGTPTVSWKNCQSVCAKDTQINSWELFFEPLNPGIHTHARNVLCIGKTDGPDNILYAAKSTVAVKINNLDHGTTVTPRSLLNLSFRKRNAPGFASTGIITHSIKLWANYVLTKYIRIKKRILRSVDDFYSKHMAGNNVLGIHIRGTDHAMETESRTLPPISLWIQNAEDILNSMLSPKKIFVAGDNRESIKKFVTHFGAKVVVFTDAFRAVSYEGLPVHDSAYDSYRVGHEVLVDILLLAKCDHFLHAESSVSALVTYFNPTLSTSFLGYGAENEKQQPESEQDKDGTTKVTLDLSDINTEEFAEDMKEIEENYKRSAKYSECPNMAKRIFASAADFKCFIGTSVTLSDDQNSVYDF